jgi:hypothetical protein
MKIRRIPLDSYGVDVRSNRSETLVDENLEAEVKLLLLYVGCHKPN